MKNGIMLKTNQVMQLDNWLKHQHGLNAVYLQGFIYGINCSPGINTIDDWLPILLGKMPYFCDQKEAEYYLPLFEQFFDYVAYSLTGIKPSFPIATEKNPLGDLTQPMDDDSYCFWANGFIDALKINKPYWYQDNNIEKKKMVRWIFCLTNNDKLITKYFGRDARDLGIDGLRKKAMVILPHCIQSLLRIKNKKRIPIKD